MNYNSLIIVHYQCRNSIKQVNIFYYIYINNIENVDR